MHLLPHPGSAPAPIALESGVGEIDLAIPGGDWGTISIDTDIGRASISGMGTVEIFRADDTAVRAVMGAASGPGITLETNTGDATVRYSDPQ